MTLLPTTNRFRSEIVRPVDGTQPTGSGFGTTVTASGTTHTKGSWVDLITAGDWSGFSGDALEWVVTFNAANASGTIIRIFADIGIDTGSGYVSIVDNLSAAYAASWTNGANGVPYELPLQIPNGAKVGCRIQSNVASQTVSVGIILRGNPSEPGQVRCGTFARTFGADTANTQGVSITSGAASDGAWTEITSATSDDLWFWDVGWAANDATLATGGAIIDLATGAASSESKIIEGFIFSKSTTEYIGKVTHGRVYHVASGARISTREQSQTGETGETHIVYAIGGDYLPPTYTYSGNVQVDDVIAPESTDKGSGEYYPRVYLLDVTDPSSSDLVRDTATEGALYSLIDASGDYSFKVPYSSHLYALVYFDTDDAGGDPIVYTVVGGGSPQFSGTGNDVLIYTGVPSGGSSPQLLYTKARGLSLGGH